MKPFFASGYYSSEQRPQSASLTRTINIPTDVAGALTQVKDTQANPAYRVYAARACARFIHPLEHAALKDGDPFLAQLRDATERDAVAQRDIAETGDNIQAALERAYRDPVMALRVLKANLACHEVADTVGRLKRYPDLLGTLNGGVLFDRGARRDAVRGVADVSFLIQEQHRYRDARYFAKDALNNLRRGLNERPDIAHGIAARNTLSHIGHFLGAKQPITAAAFLQASQAFVRQVEPHHLAAAPHLSPAALQHLHDQINRRERTTAIQQSVLQGTPQSNALALYLEARTIVRDNQAAAITLGQNRDHLAARDAERWMQIGQRAMERTSALILADSNAMETAAKQPGLLEEIRHVAHGGLLADQDSDLEQSDE